MVFSEGMNAAFNILGTIGSSFQDELSAAQGISQEEGVKNSISCAIDSSLNASMLQNAMMQESQKKFNANLANQQIGLLMYQNFITNTFVNAPYQIEAVGLGQEYTNLLTPTTYPSQSSSSIKYVSADIGYPFGLTTQINSLYPQLGFYTATTGRPHFPYAQEIAEQPLIIDSQAGQTPSSSISKIKQLWFNQRTMIPLSSQKTSKPLQATMLFRYIYSLQTTTYTGLYIGGTFEDYRSPSYIQNLQNTGLANLNVTHLAKMFVLVQNSDGTTNIGLYEKDGLGSVQGPDGNSWIFYEALSKDFTTGWPIYDMHASLDNNKLSLVLTRKDKPTVKPWQKVVTVTPTDQRMLGVITSGSAIEWNIAEPSLSIQQIQSVRTNAQQSPSSQIILCENDREIQSLQSWSQKLSPTFGSFTLNALSKYYYMNGKNIYTTTSTGLKDANNAPMTDYVVYANNANSTISNIGIDPYASDTDTSSLVLVSLGSGNVYDIHGNVLSTHQNVWASYNTIHGPFAPAITTAINAIEQACFQALLKQTIGVFNLTAADSSMISDGLYVYTTTQTLNVPGKPPITDYIITSTVTTDTNLQGNQITTIGNTIGGSPSSSTQGFLSLVTGNLYLPNSLTPTGSVFNDTLSNYQAAYKPLPKTILDKIRASLNKYSQEKNPTPKPSGQKNPPSGQKNPQTPPVPVIIPRTTPGSISNPGQPGGVTLNLFGTSAIRAQSSAKPSASTVALQQHVASGGLSFNLGLMGSSPSSKQPLALSQPTSGSSSGNTPLTIAAPGSKSSTPTSSTSAPPAAKSSSTTTGASKLANALSIGNS